MQVFGKTMKSFRKHRDIKLVTTKIRRNCLMSEANYFATKFFSENLQAIEMKKKHRYFSQVYQDWNQVKY